MKVDFSNVDSPFISEESGTEDVLLVMERLHFLSFNGARTRDAMGFLSSLKAPQLRTVRVRTLPINPWSFSNSMPDGLPELACSPRVVDVSLRFQIYWWAQEPDITPYITAFPNATRLKLNIELIDSEGRFDDMSLLEPFKLQTQSTFVMQHLTKLTVNVEWRDLQTQFPLSPSSIDGIHNDRRKLDRYVCTSVSEIVRARLESGDSGCAILDAEVFVKDGIPSRDPGESGLVWSSAAPHNDKDRT